MSEHYAHCAIEMGFNACTCGGFERGDTDDQETSR